MNNNSSLSPLNRLNTNRSFTVTVEGNIGSGKTTLLKYFQQFNDVEVLSEPVNKWRDCRGYNLLEKMYSEPKKWSFTFQSYVYLTMIENHTRTTPHPVKLMERSIYSARSCFVEQMMRANFINECSVTVLDEWFNWIKENTDLSVDLIVYLRTTPEIAYERTVKRSRSEEQCVSFDYILDMHNRHEDWLYHKKIFNCPAPVLVIDANLDKTVIQEEYLKCKTKIFSHKALRVVA